MVNLFTVSSLFVVLNAMKFGVQVDDFKAEL